MTILEWQISETPESRSEDSNIVAQCQLETQTLSMLEMRSLMEDQESVEDFPEAIPLLSNHIHTEDHPEHPVFQEHHLLQTEIMEPDPTLPDSHLSLCRITQMQPEEAQFMRVSQVIQSTQVLEKALIRSHMETEPPDVIPYPIILFPQTIHCQDRAHFQPEIQCQFQP